MYIGAWCNSWSNYSTILIFEYIEENVTSFKITCDLVYDNSKASFKAETKDGVTVELIASEQMYGSRWQDPNVSASIVRYYGKIFAIKVNGCGHNGILKYDSSQSRYDNRGWIYLNGVGGTSFDAEIISNPKGEQKDYYFYGIGTNMARGGI